MAKNIAIFSDGTGQDGSTRPEQRMSNVFKLFRAARPGPDSPIDALKQVAFYDPGLGTDESAGAGLRPVRAFRKLMGSVFGSGISTNIVDAYEFILNHYEPGDRIYLIGFSRGAYTVRCVANLLMLCGVPTEVDGKPIAKFRKASRDIARTAVSTVFDVGAGQSREAGHEERAAAAKAFRTAHASHHPQSEDASNAAPYFIGVFDSVAALGAKGGRRVVMAASLALVVLALSAGAAWFAKVTLGLGFWWAFIPIMSLFSGLPVPKTLPSPSSSSGSPAIIAISVEATRSRNRASRTSRCPG